jgi:hypothetical protein
MAIKNKSGPHKPKISLNKACEGFHFLLLLCQVLRMAAAKAVADVAVLAT